MGWPSDTIIDATDAVAERIYNVGNIVRSSIEGMARTVWETIKDMGITIKDTVTGVYDNVAADFFWIVEELQATIQEVVAGITTGYNSAIDMIGGMISDALMYVSDGFANTVNTIKDSLGSTFDGVNNFLSGFWQDAKEMITDASQSAWDYVTTVGGSVYNWLKTLMGDVWDYFWQVAIPALGQMLVAVIESDEVTIVLEILGDVFESLINRVLSIDEETVAEWIERSVHMFKTVAQAAV